VPGVPDQQAAAVVAGRADAPATSVSDVGVVDVAGDGRGCDLVEGQPAAGRARALHLRQCKTAGVSIRECEYRMP